MGRLNGKWLLALLAMMGIFAAGAPGHAATPSDSKSEKDVNYLLGDESSGEPDSRSREVEWERWNRATVLWQAAAGVLGGVGAFYIAGHLGSDRVEVDELVGDFDSLAWGTIFLPFGTTMGVQVAGMVLGGDGNFFASFGGSILGGLLGGALGLVTFLALPEIGGYGLGIVYLGGAVTGGITGYHLSASSEIPPRVSISPTDGGMAMTLGFEF